MKRVKQNFLTLGFLIVICGCIFGTVNKREAFAASENGFVKPTTDLNLSEYAADVSNLTTGKKISFAPGNGKYMFLAFGRPTVCPKTQTTISVMEKFVKAIDSSRMEMVLMNADEKYSDSDVKAYLKQEEIKNLPVINITADKKLEWMDYIVSLAEIEDRLPMVYPTLLLIDPTGHVVRYGTNETRGFYFYRLLVDQCGEDIFLKTKQALKIINGYLLQEKQADKGYELIQKYADPEYFMTNSYAKNFLHQKLTKEQKKLLKSEAEKAVTGCSTDYEKIDKIVQTVAQRVYYDFPYVNKETKSTNKSPYAVWVGRRAVCQGYTYLTTELLYLLDIPCMILYGQDHAFNAAYDREDKKWIFFDTTWASGNQILPGGKSLTGDYNESRFDISQEEIKNLTCHEFWWDIEGLLYKNIYYKSEIYFDEEDWKMHAENVKNKNEDFSQVKKILGIKTKYNKFVPVYYTITYQMNGGKNHAKNPKKYSALDSISLKAPKKTGFVFVGWYADAKYKKKVVKIKKGSKGNKVFYAKWKKK